MTTETGQKKKWWQSKISLLAIGSSLFFATNAGFDWFGTQVTPEELAALEQAYPQGVDLVKRAIDGEPLLNLLGSAVGLVIWIWRVWFTDKQIAGGII